MICISVMPQASISACCAAGGWRRAAGLRASCSDCFDFEPAQAADDGLSVIFTSSKWGPLVNIEQNMRLLVFRVHQANAAPKGAGNEHSNLILGNFPIRSLGFTRDRRGPLRAMGRTSRDKKPDDEGSRPSRTEEARKVAEEYAQQLREIIKKLRRPLN